MPVPVLNIVKKYKHELLLFTLFLFIFISSTLLTYYLFPKKNFGSQIEAADSQSKSFREHETEIDSQKEFNLLLIGHGGPGHPGGSLADAIQVLHLDTENKAAALISIPRDSLVELPMRSDLKENRKINEAFAIGSSDTNYPLKEPEYKGEHGGGEMAKYGAEQIVGMPIDYYLAVDFNNFERIINILGGLEIDVPVEFDDYWYPAKGKELETCGYSPEEIAEISAKYSGFNLQKQFPCRYEHIHFDKGINEMDGATALKFVRSRHSGQHGGDFARGVRQQTLLLGLKDKLLSIEAIKNVKSLYQELGDFVKTDIGVQEAISLAELMANPSEFEVSTVKINDQNVLRSSKGSNGQFILVPKDGVGNWLSAHKLIQNSVNTN